MQPWYIELTEWLDKLKIWHQTEPRMPIVAIAVLLFIIVAVLRRVNYWGIFGSAKGEGNMVWRNKENKEKKQKKKVAIVKAVIVLLAVCVAYLFIAKASSLFITIMLFLAGILIILSFTYVQPDSYINVIWKFPFSSTVGKGHFIATGWQQSIRAQVYGPGWRFVFLVHLFGVIKQNKLLEIPEGKFGLVFARDGEPLKVGQVIAEKHVECASFTDGETFLRGGGQRGYQLQLVPPGTYAINQELFAITQIEPLEISTVEESFKNPKTGEEETRIRAQIGIVNALMGKEIPEDMKRMRVVAEAPKFDEGLGHFNFQNLAAFINASGQRGIQEEIIEPGKWAINPKGVEIKKELAPFVPAGAVGVVISNQGNEPSEEDKEFIDADGNGKQVYILKRGVANKRGILSETKGPGDHFMHPLVYRMIAVDTTWRSLLLDGSKDEFAEVNVVTEDGFTVPMQAELVFRVSPGNAPKVIALAGSVEGLEEDIIVPFVDDISKRLVSGKKISMLFTEREDIRKVIQSVLKEELEEKFFMEVSTFRIIKFDFEKSPDAEARIFANLLARQANALQEQKTVVAETEVAVKRIELERNNALANRQDIVVTAEMRAAASEQSKKYVETMSGPLLNFINNLPDNFVTQLAGIIGIQPGEVLNSLANFINSIAKRNEEKIS